MSRKILILFSSSDIGGAEISISRMAINNNNKDYEYKFATFGCKGDLSQWLEQREQKILVFNHNIFLLLKYFFKNRNDIVYVFGLRLSILLRFFKIIHPNYFLIHGVRWNPSTNNKLDKIFRFVEKFLNFLIDGYIVNSDATRQTLKNLKLKNVALIYNGIKNKTQQKNGQKILTIANLNERKGYINYLRVIKKIIKKVPNSQFIFIGRDYMNGKVQSTIGDLGLENNISYLGYQKDLQRFFDESSIFVLPSKYGEGCPTSILEALSNSIPVVAYKIDGIPEILRDGIDGYLCDNDDDFCFEKKILSLITDNKIRIKMGHNGSQNIKQNFSLDIATNEHNRYFGDLIRCAELQD